MLRFFKIKCLTLATALFVGGCSVAPIGLPRPRVPSSFSPEQANNVAFYAMGLVGTPYRYGGNSPEEGFDCSGLIGHVYRSEAKFSPPRTVLKMQNWDQSVSGSHARSGDVILFYTQGVATHAGIYVGNGRFVHAPATGGEVRLDVLTSNYWSKQPTAFRRP